MAASSNALICLISAFKLRSHIIYYDTDLNSVQTAYVNVYQSFQMIAMKYHAYLKVWRPQIARNPMFFLSACSAESTAHELPRVLTSGPFLQTLFTASYIMRSLPSAAGSTLTWPGSTRRRTLASARATLLGEHSMRSRLVQQRWTERLLTRLLGGSSGSAIAPSCWFCRASRRLTA